jgi:2-methylisocitrate lyase-like PEP mutase family enzyme
MNQAQVTRARVFRELHAPGHILVLPNAWDAGSARFIESCGAPAIATTSAGVAWAHGYPDGNVLPADVLAHAVAEIARVIKVPLSVDFEAGYSADLTKVGERIAPVLDAGAVGINLEDGTESPDLLCAKIGAIKSAAQKKGVDLYVNARTDVYLKRLALVPPERALEEAVARGRKYLAAGADGLFVPALTDRDAIRTIAREIPVPLNVMIAPGLAPVAELQSLGVRRVSAGSAIAQSSFDLVKRATLQLLKEGRYDVLGERGLTHLDLNKLFGQ